MSTFLGTEIVYFQAMLVVVPMAWLTFVVRQHFYFKFSAVEQFVFAVFCFLLLIASYVIVMYPIWPVAEMLSLAARNDTTFVVRNVPVVWLRGEMLGQVVGLL